MRNTRASQIRGFTLIEMLVVIIIIAVISSVTVPRYYDFAMKARFQESVDKVLGVFADARHKAIESGADCIVRYDASSGTFIVDSEVPAPTADQPVALQESTDVLATLPSEPVTLGENIAVSDFQVDNPSDQHQQPTQRSGARQMEIHFHEDGRADAAMIMLVGAEGEREVIEISAPTGRASIAKDLDQ